VFSSLEAGSSEPAKKWKISIANSLHSVRNIYGHVEISYKLNGKENVMVMSWKPPSNHSTELPTCDRFILPVFIIESILPITWRYSSVDFFVQSSIYEIARDLRDSYLARACSIFPIQIQRQPGTASSDCDK
jgi:hypothetical protein